MLVDQEGLEPSACFGFEDLRRDLPDPNNWTGSLTGAGFRSGGSLVALSDTRALPF
jgi:hypothetical protein